MQKIDFSDCPTHGRADALRKALSFLHLSREGKKTKPAIVETGCIRRFFLGGIAKDMTALFTH